MDSTISPHFGKFTPHLALIGAISSAYVCFKLAYSILTGIRTHVLSKPLGLAVNVKKLGSWAVITGATDGIGKSYAFQLAKRGLNIVLISRTQEKLTDVANEISSRYNSVQVKTVAVDFTKTDIYDKIEQELAGLDIGVLVNNVGMSYEYPEYMLEMSSGREFLYKIMTCNMVSMTIMTQICMPRMVEKRKGAVINVSSASAVHATPLLSVYAATKAYVDRLSQGLESEYRSKGIHVQSVLPYFVATKLSGIRRSSLFTPDPDTYVNAALNTLGVESRTFGYLFHSLQAFVVTSLPDWLNIKIGHKMLGAVRVKALKKIKRKAEQRKELEEIVKTDNEFEKRMGRGKKKD